MTDPSFENEKKLLEFLEGDLSQQEQEEIQRSIDEDPAIAECVKAHQQIDESLARLFQPPEVDQEFIERIRSTEPLDAETDNTPSIRKLSSRYHLVTALATAAVITFALISLKPFFFEPKSTIAYQQRPLIEVYEKCVDEGFEPYWVCDDPRLFATTFDRRQGVQLKLADLPEGQEMLGISYLAGLSHDSTSMLATIDGEKVIVVVDKIANDWGPKTGDFPDASLRVSRWEQFGLVFYQVSPPDAPLLTDAFELTDSKYETE